MYFLQKYFLCILLFGVSSSGWALRGFSSATPTFYVNAAYGLATTKSKFIESNDTSTGLSYEVGGYAGKHGSIGFAYRTDTMETDFELNSSSSLYTWKDTILRYRLGFLYMGAVFNTMNLTVNQQGTDRIDGLGTGIGGNLGLLFSVANRGYLFIDAITVPKTNIINELDTEVSIRGRLMTDLGAAFNLTRYFDLVFGYRQQSFTLETDASYKEQYLLTYFGAKFFLVF